MLWSLILFLYLTHQKGYSAKRQKVQVRDWKHKSQQMEKPKLLFSIQISLTGCILAVLMLLFRTVSPAILIKLQLYEVLFWTYSIF